MLSLAIISMKEAFSGCQQWGRTPLGLLSWFIRLQELFRDRVCETSVLWCCCGSASPVLGPRSCRSQGDCWGQQSTEWAAAQCSVERRSTRLRLTLSPEQLLLQLWLGDTSSQPIYQSSWKQS